MQLHKNVFALERRDVVISQRRTWRKGKARRIEKNTRKKRREKKKEIEERAINSAHVIACFILRSDNCAFGTLVRILYKNKELFTNIIIIIIIIITIGMFVFSKFNLLCFLQIIIRD